MPRITIKQGDILDEHVDIIVSTANPMLLMSGGVNGAILMRGGQDVQKELQDHLAALRRKFVDPGSVIVTGPGPLACKHILHAVSINAFYESDVELIANTVRNVLDAAAELKAGSMAIPALATGYGPLTVAQFAEGLREGLDSLERSDWFDKLDLRVVIWHENEVDVVRRSLSSLQRATSAAARPDDTPMPPPSPITGVAEIVLSVRAIPPMRAFYTSVLGFSLHSESCHEHGAEPEPDGEATISFLTITNTGTPLGRHGHPQLIALIDYRRHVFASARIAGHDVTRSTLNHLAFEIAPETYDAWRRHLDSHGLDPKPTEFPHMSARALFIKDPEGNTLELICHHPVED